MPLKNDDEARIKKMIGANIRAARDRADLTQEALAKLVGVETQGAVGHWETGRKQIPCDKLFKVAEVLGTSPAALIDPAFRPGAAGIVAADSPYAELIKKALHVLQSGMHFQASLEQNIESFYLGVVEATSKSEKIREEIRQEARKEAREEITRMMNEARPNIEKAGPFVGPGIHGPTSPRKPRRKGHA